MKNREVRSEILVCDMLITPSFKMEKKIAIALIARPFKAGEEVIPLFCL